MRAIHRSTSFERKLVKFLKRHHDLGRNIEKIFSLLQRDLHHPTLETHKLHGQLADSFACSINYEYRLIFSFDDKYIYPHSIGSHDEVY